jgi:phosphonopyruvate decarboxylase
VPDSGRIRSLEFQAELKRLGFDFFTGVPCSVLAPLIEAIGEAYIPSIREDTALGLAAGAYLGGRKACVLMQNSGLGYCLNVLTSLNALYRIPALIVVSYRGAGGEDAPEHRIMGRHCLELTATFELAACVGEKRQWKESLADANRHIEGGGCFCLFLKAGMLA